MTSASAAIIAALIGLIGSGVGSAFGVLASAKTTQYRLEQLEKKVQAHNSLVERIYKLETRTDVQEGEIKAVADRVENLERSKKR